MTDLPPPTLWRRLAAIVYDLLLLISVWFLAGFVALPFNGGDAPAQSSIGYQAYLLAVTFTFYAWFWVRRGGSIGMHTWNMRIVSNDGHPVEWEQAVIRFFAAGLSIAIFGLGFVWILFDKDNRAWHDRLSKTHFVSTPKRNKKKKP